MPTRSLTCPQGHQWEASTDDSVVAETSSDACPHCRARVDEPEPAFEVEAVLPNRLNTPTIAHVSAPGPAGQPETLFHESQVRHPPKLATNLVPGYHIVAELGRGGMGVVYKAVQQKLNREVALKMILAGNQAAPADLARFRAEAEAAAHLQHPNIVQVYEVGEFEDRAYFSLEYVEGGSLAQRIKGVPLPINQAVELLEQLARAIHAAHEKSVIHRDLKPANVLLTTDGKPKITDFGLAKWLNNPSGLTATHAVMGTPSYMAPEQAEGKTSQIGKAVDVYALGATFYEMLTGRPPFNAETPLETVMQVVNVDPVPPCRLRPKLPGDLDIICLKCLEKDPRKRYASALELAEDLARFRAGQPIHARATPYWEQALKWARRRPAVAALIAVVILGVGMLAYLGWTHDRAMQETLKQTKEERDRAEAAEKTAEEERARAQALLQRIVDVVEEQSDALESSKRDLVKNALPGAPSYKMATVYAHTAEVIGKAKDLSDEDRHALAEKYATRAVRFLETAREYGYFNFIQHRDQLRTDRELNPLRGREDFRRFETELARTVARPGKMIPDPGQIIRSRPEIFIPKPPNKDKPPPN